MSSKQAPAVLVFSKGITDENVKTRLSPVLNSLQRRSLHAALLNDAIAKARSTGFQTYLYLTGGVEPFENEIQVKIQNGKDLGERMLNAFREAMASHDRIVIIGTDSPALNTNTIQDAVEALGSHDAVLGPSSDGGYYLIGLSRIIVELFSDIEWGSEKVFAQTISRMNSSSYFLLPEGFDVDMPSDLILLEKMRDNLRMISPQTAKWLEDWANERNQTT